MDKNLTENVLEWADSRGILDKATRMGQALKTLEETHELLMAVDNLDRDEIKDAIGDVAVTIIIQAEMNQLTFKECLQSAYDTINKRQGKMVNGQFVKNK